jgi:hypothetical protein
MRGASSVVLAAATIAFRSRVEFTTKAGVVVRYLAVPCLTAWLFLAFASGGMDRAPTSRDALCAGLATAALASSTALTELMSVDRFEGVTAFTVTASRGRLLGWLGRAGFVSATGAVTGLVGTTASLVVTAGSGAVLSPTDLLAIPLGSLSSVGVGLTVGAIGLVQRDSLLLSNLVQRGLPIVCGVVAPLGGLVSGGDAVARLFPLGLLVQSTRQASFWNPYDLTTLLVCSTVWTVVGLLLRVSLERHARRRGTSELLTAG